ncbi:hypothetical protein ACFSTA_17815 [Ornithinibacillus salinisoli]|uniref:Uncharacterized protein n=1 Tax=Ornithinibacillus salinisoli TaxID=1848459 RepID=A0ABW4W1C8_9BACI
MSMSKSLSQKGSKRDRDLDEEKIPFRESRIHLSTTLFLLIGFLISFVPSENWLLMTCNVLIALLGGVVLFFFWRIHQYYRAKYYSIVTYVMLNTLAIYFSIPIIRMTYGTVGFWICIVLLTFLVLFPYIFSELAAGTILKPSESKLGTFFLIYIVAVVLFGSILYANFQGNDNPNAFALAIFSFLLAIFFFVLAPIVLLKFEKMTQYRVYK